MIKININQNDPESLIKICGSSSDVSKELYTMFIHLTKFDHFKSALFAYLEADVELRDEFMKYHESETTKNINSIIDKIFGEDDE